MTSIKRIITRVIDPYIINGLFSIFVFVILFFVNQVFLFSSFTIPSNSMEPVLYSGDQALVSKLIPGPRLFNLFASLRGEQTEIYRAPGIRKIRRNDVVVCNMVHPKGWDKIEMHILKYYIKRCIGVPGDSVEIRNGFYHVRGLDLPLGNLESQDRISCRGKDSFDEVIYCTFKIIKFKTICKRK